MALLDLAVNVQRTGPLINIASSSFAIIIGHCHNHLIHLNIPEGLLKSAKKVTIDEAQNTVQSNGSVANGFLKPTTLDLGPDQNVPNGRFSVSPVAPVLDGEGSRRQYVMHGSHY